MAGIRVLVLDEEQRICLVRHGYGRRDWNVPGGGIDQGESLLDAARREVREETGMEVRIESLIGLYSLPESSDLVAFVSARVESPGRWSSNDEIAEVAFFPADDLPRPMHPGVVRCLQDAAAGMTGVVRVLNTDGTVQESLDRE